METGSVFLEPLRLVLSGDFVNALHLLASERFHSLNGEQKGAALALRAFCHERFGCPGAMDEAQRQLMDADHTDVEALHGCAMMLSDLGALELAEELLIHVTTLVPQAAPPWFNLGVTYERSGQLEEAIRHYDRAFALDPLIHHSMLCKARCLRELGQLEEAKTLLQDCTRVQPADAYAWLQLAEVEGNLGNRDLAERAYLKAQEINPSDEGLYFSWAQWALAFQDRDHLLSCCQKLDQLHPESWCGAMTHAMLRELDGDGRGAWERCCEACLRAGEAGDSAALQKCVLLALGFGARHRPQSNVDDIVEVVHRAELYSEEVLSALRVVTGPYDEELTDYFVLVSAQASPPPPPRGMVVPSFGARYLRAYRVFGRDAQEAGQAAVAFEQRSGGSDAQVDTITPHQPQQGEYAGVWWRAAQQVWISGSERT